MRWCFTTSLLSIAISVLLLLRSFDVHLSRDLIHGDDANSLPHLGVVASLNATLFHRHNLAICELPRPPSRRFPPPAPVSILLPDWETFLLLPLPSSATADRRNFSCLFHNGAVSHAGFVRIVPTSSAYSAFCCPIPKSVRRHRQSRTPHLIDPTAAAPESDSHNPHSKMIRWTRLAYEAVSTPTDMIVFAKGVNSSQGVNRPASDLGCFFSSSVGIVATTPVTSSAQEVLCNPR